MEHPLDSAFVKLDRAREHLDSLSMEIDSSAGRDAYEGTVEFTEATGWHVLRIRVVRDLPRSLGAIVGDVVTNLRGALDHSVYGLAVAAGVAPGRTQFPIYSTPKVFVDNAPRDLVGLPSRWRAVFEALQPYHDDVARHPLTLLRDYSNADKHRVIHVALAVPAEHRLTLEPVEPIPTEGFSGMEAWTAERRPLEDGDEILGVRFPSAPTTRVRVSGAVGLDVVFGERLLTWSDLDLMRRHAVEVVEALEEALARVPASEVRR